MSVKVDLGTLGDTMADYTTAYLLTVSDDQRPHAVAVRPEVDGTAVRVADLGRRTRANVVDRPDVTLLFPPLEAGGYSLIVDGTAVAETEAALVTPVRAVLHRPTDHAVQATDGTCGNDCVDLPTS